MKTRVFALLAGLVLPFSAVANSVTLAWDPSPSPDVIGYKIYYGLSSGNYTGSFTYPNVTTGVVAGLAPNVTYYFAATAFNVLGLESDFSGEAAGMAVQSKQTVTVSWPAQAQSISIEQSSDLVNWSPLFTAPPGYTSVTVSVAPGAAFFRAVMPNAASVTLTITTAR